MVRHGLMLVGPTVSGKTRVSASHYDVTSQQSIGGHEVHISLFVICVGKPSFYILLTLVEKVYRHAAAVTFDLFSPTVL